MKSKDERSGEGRAFLAKKLVKLKQVENKSKLLVHISWKRQYE